MIHSPTPIMMVAKHMHMIACYSEVASWAHVIYFETLDILVHLRTHCA